MSRYFNIKITSGTSAGPYNVYYNATGSTYATLVSDGSNATGLTYSQLTTGNGVLVEIPDGSTSIILFNTLVGCQSGISYVFATPTPTPTYFCEFDVDLNIVTATPTPTPTPTPDCNFDVDLNVVTATPTPTPTPTDNCDFDVNLNVITATPTPTPTPTDNCEFDINLNVVTATPTPTPTPTENCDFGVNLNVVTATPTPTPTPTENCEFNVDLNIVTATPTPTASSTPTPTATSTPTPTPTPTNTPTPTPTPTENCDFGVNLNVVTATPTPTSTPTPTPTPTENCDFGVNVGVNFIPTDIVLSNNTINENSATGTTIGTLSVTTLDSSDTHIYTIISGGTNFNISGTSLRSSQIFNYEATSSYSVTIRVTDSVGQYFDKSFTINVLSVNEAPYGLTLDNNSQQENTATGTTIGTFTGLDIDSGDTLTYALYDTANYPDNNSFTVTTNGVLKNASVFNYESKTSYSIKVRVTDAGGLTYDGTFTINVTNVNETPTNISLSSSSISENVPTGTTIGTLSATDPDAGDTFTYSLYDTATYPDNSSFSIVSGVLKTAAIFNYETKSSYSIRVRVTDAGGLTFDKTLTITITDVTLAVSASATTNVTCYNGSDGIITVSGVVGGTANYTYSKDGTNYQSSATFNGLTAGSYTIYAKDSYNEVGSTSVTVTQPSVVSVSASGTNPTCYGGSDGSIVVSSATGGSGSGFTYSKDGSSWQSSTTFSSLSSATYTIWAKDSNNCTGSTSVTLTRTQVTATVSQNQTTCYGGSDGSIVVSNLSGGQGGPYSTKLNSGGTYQVITTSRTYSSLSAGSYTIYVKDSAGCENTYSISVTEPTTVSVSAASTTYATCYNSTDGSVTLSASGGSGTGYQYRRNGGTWQSSATFSGLPAASSTYEAKDSSGCVSSAITIDMTKTAPNATITVNNVSCNGGSNGSIVASSPNGGNSGAYTVSINGSTYYTFPKTFSSLAAGSYTIYVKDYLGCVAEYGQSLSEPTAQTAGLSVVTKPTCVGVAANSDGVMQLTSTGGTWPKTYRLYADTTSPYSTCGGTLVGTWTNVTSGAATFNATGLTYYGYCLEVTDANNCVTNSGVVELPVDVTYSFSPNSASATGSGSSSTTNNTTITVTCGVITVRMTTAIQTGYQGSSSITIPGVGTYATSTAQGQGNTAFVDFVLGPGTYSVTNWVVNVNGGGTFTVVTSTLTKI